VEDVVQAAYQPWADLLGMRPPPMDAPYAELIDAGRVHVTGADGIEGLIVLVPEPDALLVENVAVRPALHGRGIGRRLLAFADAEARRLGLGAVRLYTNARMTRNVTLYASLGYAETGRQPVGAHVVVHMRKPLDPAAP
jgi:GNAT superfamily N-acetyltransferase